MLFNLADAYSIAADAGDRIVVSPANTPGRLMVYSASGTLSNASDFSGDRVWQIKPVMGIPTPAGLVSWWRGEGNTADKTGAHPGTPVGGLAFPDRHFVSRRAQSRQTRTTAHSSKSQDHG